MAEGKKARKLGRNSSRPSQISYVASKRSEVNRRKKQLRHAKAVEKKAKRKMKGVTPRGEARALRRDNQFDRAWE